MGFLDETVITVVSGDGGKGCVSFRREKFIPKGGPDGGDGGKGGNVIIKATSRLHTLYDFSSRKHFKAPHGKPGKGKRQAGRHGSDVVINDPLGTILYDDNTGELIADLICDNQEVLILSGGQGGKGNTHFSSSTNRSPRYAQPGLPGEEKKLKLSLKYLADVGLIGLPNAGKSTLLSRLTMARPRIDSYPFTTIIPNLGVIEFDNCTTLTIADIPGLIEGASEGKGLGFRFLRHIERTKFLLHLIDITYNPCDDILEDFNALHKELERYNTALVKKEQFVLINKTDQSSGHRDIKEIQHALIDIGIESLPISALTGHGLEGLKNVLALKFQDRLIREEQLSVSVPQSGETV
ncbi:MAG: GTPase ObgE [Deltaproteobacteria bacterium]|nr:GTPase ObgE [Deltaproteobacteria bacterium]